MQKVYLDTNIFITFFLKREGYGKIKDFMNKSQNLEIEFVTSDWTLTEIVKVLIYEYKKKSKKVAEFIQELQRGKRIFNTKFSFIEVSEKEGYDFGEFFYNVQKIILEYNSGFPDSIHSLIMRNHNIKYILTTNEKDFQGIRGIEAINPINLELK